MTNLIVKWFYLFSMVEKRTNDKHETYSSMLQQASLLHSQNKLQSLPSFYAPVISHRCEFGKDTFALIERLANFAGKQSLSQQNIDSLSLQEVRAKTRSKAKDRLVQVMVQGMGAQLLATGFPISRRAGSHNRNGFDY